MELIMNILKEITDDWKCTYHVPNHYYILEGTRAIGYIKENTKTPIIFSKPIFFDKRKRKFVKLTKKQIKELELIL